MGGRRHFRGRVTDAEVVEEMLRRGVTESDCGDGKIEDAWCDLKTEAYGSDRWMRFNGVRNMNLRNGLRPERLSTIRAKFRTALAEAAKKK